MKKKSKKILKIVSFIILTIAIILTIIYFLSPSYTIFSFIEENNKSVDGKVFFDGELYGITSEGKIKVYYLEEVPENITFEGYGVDPFSLFYNFPKDYWNYSEEEFLVENANSSENKAKLYFYDTRTSCPLNGSLFFGEQYIGELDQGNFLLSKKQYNQFWIGELKVKGLTTECFGRNKNLPFVEYWEMNDSLDYYFEVNDTMEFITELNPRYPRYYEEMQGFIRPFEVQERLSKINLDTNKSDFENLEQIFAHTFMNYVTDKGNFGEYEYWQTPKDFIENKGGDCEDWAIYTISLIRLYNSSWDCYAASWWTHMNVLCFVDDKFIILDQEKTEKDFFVEDELSRQENEINARKWRNGYFEEYGIPPEERRLDCLFNEKDLIVFEDGKEDFIKWVIDKGLEKK